MKKSSPQSFPYRVDASGNSFPIIPVSLGLAGKKKELFALVDSGANISIFHSEVADSLGIRIERGKKTYLGGVGGRIKGFIHQIKIEVARKKFVCPVVFSREYMVSFNLLGREAFFERFKITFEEKKALLSLE